MVREMAVVKATVTTFLEITIMTKTTITGRTKVRAREGIINRVYWKS
jgi:hypothetical protein